MVPKLDSSLTREIGTSRVGLGSGTFWDTWEETPELQWPNSVIMFDRMRRSDGQLRGLLSALTLPLRRAGWHVRGDDCRPEIIAYVRDELGLDPEGRGRLRRKRQGVNFGEVLRHALLSLPLGFMPLEKVYEVGAPPPDIKGAFPDGVVHVRKLVPRMPRSLAGVDVADDGGLKGIRQIVRDERGHYVEKPIPVESLVMFVNDQEGGDWYGNSVLRGAYGHFLIKQVLLRLGPMATERQGMGLPVVGYPDGGDRALALALSRAARAGEDAGVALPEGYTLELLGVQGSTRDELPLLKYHDQAMSRSVLEMFMDLGHENGARALADTFLEFFLMAEEAVADHVGEVVTEHIIRQIVALTAGEDEPYPELLSDPITARTPATAEAIKALVEAQVLTPDDDLEADVRRRYQLPPAVGPAPDDLPDEGIDDDTVVPQDEPVDVNPTDPEAVPDFGVEGGTGHVTDDPNAKPVPVIGHPRPGTKGVRPHSRRKPGDLTGLTLEELEERHAAAGERLAHLRARG